MMKAFAGLLVLLAAQPAFAQPDWEVDGHDRHIHGARVLVLKDYRLAEGETARGPVVVLGGSASIDGHADDDVVVFGGRLRLGPTAVVDGDVVTIGGRADVDSRAQIHGRLDENATSVPYINGNWGPLPRGWFAGVALAGTILRLLLVLVIASALTLIAPGWVRRISWRAGEGMGSSGAIGLACQVAFVPLLVILVVVLAVSIVGIPLIGAMPLLVAAAAIAGTAGFTAVAARIGARMRGTTVEASNALWIDVLIGMAVVSAISVFARVVSFGPLWGNPATWSVSAMGFLVEYAVWTIGIGAACATMLARWNGPRTAPA
jgi:hypothetical protein